MERQIGEVKTNNNQHKLLAILKNRIYRIIINVWKVLPFKRGMALFLRHFSIVRNKLYKDLRFKGEFRIRVGDSNFKIYHHYYTSLENEIFWQGLETGWEAKTISLWAKVAKNSMCIFDVGANTGIFLYVQKRSILRLAFMLLSHPGQLLRNYKKMF